jgi:hypothetical protein
MLVVACAVVYGFLGFSFATLLAICHTRINNYWLVEDGSDFLFVSLWWPVVFVGVGCLSVMQLTITAVFRLKNWSLGRYVLRILDTWVSWVKI